MIIFGEKINTINEGVANALNKRDRLFFKNLALSQLNSGIVDVIDVNVGSDVAIEPDNMRWAVSCIEKAIGNRVPLSIDSSNPKTIIAGIKEITNKKGSYINSITFEENRYKKLLPLAKEYNLNIIALPIDDSGIPKSSQERVKIAEKIAGLVESYGISLSKLYIDCIVEPISLSSKNALISLHTIAKVKKNIPSVKTFICLTAISFGLPNRKIINRNFASLLLREEIDSIILDPLDKELVLNLFATKLLLGKDENCKGYMRYIKSKR
ncbi:MAG: dihydropteroate synthase [Actinobacteria bacterium]|nr:dihydropteroate synthase [Actinomycetota bacterium]